MSRGEGVMLRLDAVYVTTPVGTTLHVIGVHCGADQLTASHRLPVGGEAKEECVAVVFRAVLHAFQCCDPAVLENSVDLTTGMRNLGSSALRTARADGFAVAQRAVYDILANSRSVGDFYEIDMRRNNLKGAHLQMRSKFNACEGPVDIHMLSNRPAAGPKVSAFFLISFHPETVSPCYAFN